MLSKKALLLSGIAALIVCSTLPVGRVLAQGGESSWSEPVDMVRQSGAETGWQGVLLCDANQNTHLVWASLSEAGAAVYYQNDTADEWSVPVDVIAVSQPVISGLSAGVSETYGTIHVIWQDRHIGGDVYYSNAPMHAAAKVRLWSAPLLLVTSVDSARLVVDADGVIHVVYGQSTDNGTVNALHHVRSEDDGATWSPPLLIYEIDSLLASTISGAVAVDSTGRVHVGVTLRSQEYGAYSEVGYQRSLDGGRSWEPYRTIDADGTAFQGVTGITPYVFGSSEVHLTWHDPRRMHRWSSDGGDTWSDPTEIYPLGAAFGGRNALAQDSAGIVHAVLAEASGVYSVAWDGQTWRDAKLIDDRFLDPHGQHIAACQGNHLHVVYYDRLGQVRVWYSHRTVNAPHIARRVLPPRELKVPPRATANVEMEGVSVTGGPDVDSTQYVRHESAWSPIDPIAFSSASVLLLVVLVFAAGRRRRRQGR